MPVIFSRDSKMWRVFLGTLIGIYLAQTYELPNVKVKFKELNKYIKDNKILEEKNNE
jgi:hypothetical protein